jgi:hypothetical protein
MRLARQRTESTNAPSPSSIVASALKSCYADLVAFRIPHDPAHHRARPSSISTAFPVSLAGRRSGKRRWAFVAGAVTVVALSAPTANAGAPEFHAKLHYDVDTALPGCWDEADFRKKVAHRVGYESFRDDATAIVSVRVDGATGAIGGNVDWQDASGAKMGERHFVAKDGNCGKLLAEMAFAVALQIQMLGLAPKAAPDTPSTDEGKGMPNPSPPSPPPPEPAPRPSTEITTKVEEPPKTRPRGTMWLGLGPLAEAGVAPSPLLGGRVFFGLRRGDLSFELGAETSYPRSFRRWGGSGFRELLLAGSAALCHHQGFASGCLLGQAGELRLAGEGLDVRMSPAAFVAHAGVRLGAAVELSQSWFAALHVDGLVLLTPCTVEISGSRVWEMPRLAAFAGLDLAARFR